MMDNVRVLATELHFPEGPAFDTNGRLWCVEQEGEGLFCWNRDGSSERVHTGGRPNGSVIHNGYLWFCDSGQNAIRRLNTTTEVIETVVSTLHGEPLNMPNDLLFDDHGNLVFTCPGPPDGSQPGYVAVYSPNGSVEVVADGLSYPNGLVFYPDSRSLLISETHRQRIWCGYWDTKGTSWETIRPWATVVDTPDEAPIPGPDGMAVGPDGNLYVAVFGAGIVKVFSRKGKFVRTIHLPGQNPTNCTFDPLGKLGLIVTESERGELLSIH